MANSPNSSSCNHENGVGVGGTSTSSAFRISPSPLSSKPVSDPTITELLHHPLSINGDDEMVSRGAGQLGLNQRVSELRSRSLLTTLTKRRCLLTTTTTASSSNEGGNTMTEIAKTMVRSHLLYACSISDRLMPDQSNHNNLINLQSKLSVSFQQYSHMDHTCVTNTQYFHDDILDYPTLCGHMARPHLSSHKQPSQKRLAITGPSPDEPTNSDAKGKKPGTTSAPRSIEYFPEATVHKRGITNKRKRNDNHSPAGAPNPKPGVRVTDHIDGDSDDGDNEQGYDGRIHSLPCQKHGPYTCSKCMKVFPTSQHFAAHAAADHYKYETSEQRRKRQIAKVRRRALKLQQVKDSLTCVPIFYEWEDAGSAVLNSSAEKSANGGGGGGGKVKEQSASSEVRGNESVIPPGFEGAGIKREGGFSSA